MIKEVFEAPVVEIIHIDADVITASTDSCSSSGQNTLTEMETE